MSITANVSTMKAESSLVRKVTAKKNEYDPPSLRVLLWIQPPLETRIEPYLTGLLTKWEHELIQA
jgi:hypothetical protein